MIGFFKRDKQALLSLLFFCALSLTATGQNLTLEKLFEMADKGNLTLKKMEIASAQAAEHVTIAKQGKLPDLNVEVGFSFLGNGTVMDRNFSHPEKAPIPHFGNNYVLEASQVLYAGGAIRSGIALTQTQHQQTRVAIEQERQQLRLLITGYYLDICQLNNQERVYNEHLDLTQQIIDQVKRRVDVGAVLQNDITRHELQYEQLKLSLKRVQENRNILCDKLCLAIGIGDTSTVSQIRQGCDAIGLGKGQDFTFAYTEMNQDFNDISQQKWSEVKNAPLYKQSALNVQAAELQVKSEHAKRLPQLALVAGSRMDGPITIEIPTINKNFHYWYVGVGLKYNISSLYKSKHKMASARLNVAQRREEQQDLLAELYQSRRQAEVEYKLAMDEWKTYKKNVQLANENYDIVKNRYLNELAIATDMADAARLLLEADLQLANAEIRTAFAFYKIKYTVGGL